MNKLPEHILNVLIIDDSSDDAFALQRAIKKEGFEVHSQRVESAEQLQSALQHHVWDIVLCDVRMPELSVHDAIKIIDEFSPTPVSVVIISGMVEIDEISRFIRGGVRDFIRKDDLSKLGDVLRREMGYIEARREQESEHARFIEAQKMEAVGTLAGGVAHNFNNILTALMGMQWKLKSEYADHARLVERVDKMNGLCEDASRLVKQLLGFARKGIVQMETIDLVSFITENIPLLHISIPETITMNWHPPEQPVYISADVVQLQQILLNLVNNARDALADADHPCVSLVVQTDPPGLPDAATKNQDWVALHVMDNGSGISEGIREHLFEPFATTKEADSGTGLGLAMAYGSMMTHHGFIECSSEACPMPCDDCSKTLTSFRMLFPRINMSDAIQSESTQSDSTQLEPQADAGLRPMHVLFADDEEMIREVFCAIFEDEGSTVNAFENGLLAWEQFRKEPDTYDVVVLDVSMPKMGGPEVARKIRTMSMIPIVLISGYDVHHTLELVDDVENIHVQVKPFSPDTIFNDIKKLTGEPS